MLLRPYDFCASSLTFCLQLLILVPVACYFGFHHSIFEKVTRNVRFDPADL